MTGTLPLLHADCGQCAGLCCVALSLTKSVDFPIDKPAGEPCGNLQDDFRCEIHPELIEAGYRGCVAFDCLGAGQRVTQESVAGVDWRSSSENAHRVFETFAVMRALHELLWLLNVAAQRVTDPLLADPIQDELARVLAVSGVSPAELESIDVAWERSLVGEVLQQASSSIRSREAVRLGLPQPSSRLERLDLAGQDLRSRDLRTAGMRGALLMACNVSGADLTGTDLLGADLRDADLSGADLSDALFLMQPQLNAARGDATTLLPTNLSRPSHWRD